MDGKRILISMTYARGAQIEKRPEGLLLALSTSTDVDGWGYTLMERQEDKQKFWKRGKLTLGMKPPYRSEWYECNSG